MVEGRQRRARELEVRAKARRREIALVGRLLYLGDALIPIFAARSPLVENDEWLLGAAAESIEAVHIVAGDCRNGNRIGDLDHVIPRQELSRLCGLAIGDAHGAIGRGLRAEETAIINDFTCESYSVRKLPAEDASPPSVPSEYLGNASAQQNDPRRTSAPPQSS